MSAGAREKKYTCIACRLQFDSSEEQREHYRTDFHRFNLKRQVAELPPISWEAFHRKLDAIKQAETAQNEADNVIDVAECAICAKTFKSEGSYQQHLNSKKHKEAEAEAKRLGINTKTETLVGGVKLTTKSAVPAHVRAGMEKQNANTENKTSESAQAATEGSRAEETPAEGATLTEEEEIQKRIDNAVRLSLDDCLFCNHKSVDFEANMAHMTRAHSFFIPDIEYMKDLRGFITYLGEKISVGLTCLHCNGKGRQLHSLEAVQSHMRDLAHCKLAYEDNEDEYADYYDFDAMESDKNVGEKAVAVDASSGELVLANHKVLGHRENRVYFRQRAKPKDNQLILSLAKEYRIMAERKEQQMKMPSKHLLEHNSNHYLKIGMAANNMAHYRHQNPK